MHAINTHHGVRKVIRKRTLLVHVHEMVWLSGGVYKAINDTLKCVV